MGLFKTLFTKPVRCDIEQRFELLREAISGTMSKFYMARDRESGTVVGLKILDAEKRAAFESRFKGLKKPSEGQIASSLSHPNIVRTLEYGLTTKGDHYMVMEYIEGPGLNSLLIERNKLLDGIRVALIRQIGLALKAVHQAGYIHRDICPRNVMIEPNEGTLKLIDFGLTVPARGEFLLPGNRTGTPNYMAPELVKRRNTDQRLDIFSMGITAYEICTFELPWERGATGQAAMNHANHPSIEVERYRPRIDPRLAKAIQSCIEQNPEKRCPNVDTFLRAIRDIGHEDQIGAKRTIQPRIEG